MYPRWRLILDEERSAAFNMAADRAIFGLCAEGKCVPTLRIYGWNNPALSLGRLQYSLRGKLDFDYCRKSNIALVRRPTGGKAVLHGHDITFSIVLPEELLPANQRSIVRSHQWLMSGIVEGLRSIIPEAELGPESKTLNRNSASADCFAHVAECDVRAKKVKIVGAAQARSCGAVIEQGSIPHTVPLVDPRQVFPGANPVEPTLKGVSRSSIVDALIDQFSKTLGIEFRAETFSDEEYAAALQIEEECCVEYPE